MNETGFPPEVVLNLVLGRESEDKKTIQPLRGDHELIGRQVPFWRQCLAYILREPVVTSQVVIGLFLENAGGLPAQYVQINLFPFPVPPVEFVPERGTFKFPYRENVMIGEALVLKFCSDLVVYPGAGLYLGRVRIGWGRGVRPDALTLMVRLYELDTPGSEVVISDVKIKWV